MYGKRKRSSKGGRWPRKRFQRDAGGGTGGFRPQGDSPGYRADRASFRPSLSLQQGRLNSTDRTRIKIRTFQTFSLTSTSGAFGSTYISMNSLNQPFAAITGTHNNLLMTNLAKLYCRYRVTYSKMSFSLSPLNATSTTPMFFAATALDPTFNTVTLLNFAQVLESRLGSAKVIPAANGYNGKPVVVTVKASPAVVCGTSLVEQQNQSYEGNMTTAGTYADPVNILRFYLCYQSNDGVTTAQCSVDCYLTQYVEVFDRAIFQ